MKKPSPSSSITVGASTLAAPVNDPAATGRQPQQGIGLCLSGGGYRAMLFHLGTLWRLHDAGLLQRVDRISSVSGGSITSAALALAWPRLNFNTQDSSGFIDGVVAPVRRIAGVTIDIPAVIGGVFLPGLIASRVARSYRRHLLGDATLQDLPEAPRFVFNASNVQTAALWRFSKPYMGDWRVGRIEQPRLPLATAVAASSAFPPFLSPTRLKLDPGMFAKDTTADLQHDPFTRDVILTDGGVYDNLGLETVWKRYSTILVSDAGMKIAPDGKPRTDWAFGAMRVTDIVDSQVRSLRNRQLMASFGEPPGSANHRSGAYWSIRSDASAFPATAALACPIARTQELAATPTRLARVKPELQERLINWGYAACDAALRSYFDPTLKPPSAFPYARGV